MLFMFMCVCIDGSKSRGVPRKEEDKIDGKVCLHCTLLVIAYKNNYLYKV